MEVSRSKKRATDLVTYRYCNPFGLLSSFSGYVASSNREQIDVCCHGLVPTTHFWVRLKSCKLVSANSAERGAKRLRQPRAYNGKRYVRQMAFARKIDRFSLTYRDDDEVPLAAPSGTVNCSSIFLKAVLRQRRRGHLTG
jgi:hypothetical protein